MKVPEQFLKLPVVSKVVAKSRSSIYAAVKSGDFPAPIRTGPRAVAWTASSIAEWQESRIKASKSV